ncbi:MAG TPA: MBL fold metallo-hydrolase [Steroidobacteraceae bacterium]|nr:MBL fold metallo-hydrolase [Steroidobacteraceae bacterium]
MTHATSHRRGFLKHLAGAAAGLALYELVPRVARAGLQAPPAVPLTVNRLSDRLAVIAGAGGNIVVLSGPEGVLLVDSGSPQRSREVLEAVATLPGGHRIETVFNTHWHWEHTGGNELMRRAGARIVAHENTRLWLGTQIWVEWQNRTYPPRPQAAWPTETFYTKGKMSFAGEPIEYGYLEEAHTDGDIYVYFRGENVLVPGCVLAVGSYPVVDYSTDGWLGGMSQATKMLSGMIDEKTRIVPGIGPVQTKSDLLAENAMLEDLQDRIWHLMLKGLGIPDLIAAHPTHAYDSKWGNPDLFIQSAYRSLYAHCRELRGAV